MPYFIAFIRSLFHAIWLAFSTVGWCIAMLSAKLFFSSAVLSRMARGWCTWGIKTAQFFCGIKVRINGMENLPTDPNSRVILVVKHQSTMETLLISKIMPRPIAYVFKKEILKIPFFGWGIGSLDMIYIDRGDKTAAFLKVVEQGQRILNKGIWIVMFPEGTRIPRGQSGTYKLGAARLAVATNACIVPIAVTSAKCWPRKAFTKFSGTVDVSIGMPISSIGRAPQDLMEEAQVWIEGEMHRLDPEAYIDSKKNTLS
jgi:1-acyl-sn-glycerol-3-phosphate acyltransferase